MFFFLLFAKTPKAAPFNDSILSDKINATADKVWPLLEDFCNFYKYSPFNISFCTKGVPNRPGLVRFIAITGPPPLGGNSTVVLWEEHKLLTIDSRKRKLKYKLVDNNRLIRFYLPTFEVLRKGNGCQVRWAYRIDPVDEITPQDIRENFTEILAYIVASAERIFASTY
ncbi:hypothetical protein Leryth_015817 [Lithospermum erythrorhizon]|uniref:Uncharacterized protein n=1 Tax=Lithospermum erythrorhizon TaxID=34254 RepID=A0AAV3NVZ4_LITER|nr:hypothetical protein Leryth_015817 [Lithospermum erythrorhizon]